MTFSLADQTVYFLCSLLFGVILSALYDCVRVLRFMGFTKLWQIILSDVLYFLMCAFLTVLFALPFNKGMVRYFTLFGEAVGFVVYRFTVGEFMATLYCYIIRVLRKIIEKSIKIIRNFSSKLLKANRFVVYNVGVILYKIQNIVYRRKRTDYEHTKRT
ncbi:MAG: hypothetical protein E7513_01980 [Ruminococcaceae bacterium]|nr:hypothetical protein [Oscillospiraceae bacterium]